MTEEQGGYGGEAPADDLPDEQYPYDQQNGPVDQQYPQDQQNGPLHQDYPHDQQNGPVVQQVQPWQQPDTPSDYDEVL